MADDAMLSDGLLRKINYNEIAYISAFGVLTAAHPTQNRTYERGVA